jgi:hypothetical protein
MLVTHTRTPLSGDRISVHQVTSKLTEATRTENVTTQPKVVTRNITTKTGPKKLKGAEGGSLRCEIFQTCAVGCWGCTHL